MPKVHITGEVGYFPNSTGYIREVIESAPAGEDVHVTLDSLGGDAFEGMAIYSVLKNCGRKVITQIGSVAGSATSLIFMAGSERIMPEGTVLMIHNVAVEWTGGESADLRQTADLLEKLSGEYAKIYAANTGKTADECQALMDATTWMTSEEATRLGFATAQQTVAEADKVSMRSRQLKFAAAANKLTNCPASIFKLQANPTVMNKELLAKLGLPADATAEQIDAKVGALFDDHATLKADATAAEAKAKTDAETALTAEANTVVSDAIAAGALAEEDRTDIIIAFKADKAGTTRLVAKLVAAAKNAKPDGHGAPLKFTAQGGQFSADAFAAAANEAADGEPRAALYREFPQMAPDGKNATKLAAFKKLNPETAKALGLVK